MKKQYWWLLSVLLVPLGASAQVQTLKDAAQQAILTNPEVLSRWHAFEAANGERGVAFGGFLPRLDVTAGIGRDRGGESTIIQQDGNRHSSTVTLTQMLYDGFATSNDVKSLDHARLVRLYELHNVSETVALEVTRAYFDVLRYRALLGMAEESYVRHRSVFEQIERKALAGVGRRVDMEQASGRLALSEANLLTETSNLHDVSARFQRLVGTTPRKDMAMPAALNKDLPADINSALRISNQINPALIAAIENVRSADRSARARNASFHPRFDFRLRSENGNNLNGVTSTTRTNTAEVVMSWNLFNGFSDTSRARQYAEQLNVARDQRDKTCRDLRQTLSIAYNDTIKLTEQLKYLDQHQLSIEKARDAYRKQFDIGQRTLLDVLDTENELFQAKRAYANAENDLFIAYARTHAGIGTLFSALGLSRAQATGLPEIERNDGADNVELCPAEGPAAYVVDKPSLNLRAQELVKEAALAAEQAAAAQAEAQKAQQNNLSPGSQLLPPSRTVPAPGKSAPLIVPQLEKAPTPPALPPLPSAPPAPSRTAPVPPLPSPRSESAPSSIQPISFDENSPVIQSVSTPAVLISSKMPVVEALKNWSTAWGGLNIAEYLNSYSSKFKPAGGISRDAWATQRKNVLTHAKQVNLDVTKVQIEMPAQNRAVTTFVQSYRSSSYQDAVQKKLEWENIDGRWQIVRETVESIVPVESVASR